MTWTPSPHAIYSQWWRFGNEPQWLEEDEDVFVVTHLPSGRMLCDFLTLAEAQEFVSEIVAMPIDWDGITTIPEEHKPAVATAAARWGGPVE